MRNHEAIAPSVSLAIAIVAFTLLVPLALAGEPVKVTVKSEALGGREMPVNVLLPDGYEETGEKRFPAIYLLHGYGGDYSEWTRVGVVDESKGLDVILVMPEGDRSFWVNHHGKGEQRWEDWVTVELVSFIDSKYRTIATRNGRGISGLSMGGYGAMVLGLRHPELFGALASHSGALGVPGPAREGGGIQARLNEIFGPADTEERSEYDLLKLVEALPKERRPDIYIDCGSQDFLLEANRAYVASLAKLGVDYEYREVPGQHDFAYWKRNVRYSLEHQLAALPQATKLEVARSAPKASASEGKDEASVAVVGTWALTLVVPGGKEYEADLIVERSGAGLSARAVWDSGKIEFPKGSLDGAELVIETDTIERDGYTGVAKLEATVSGRKLEGKWGLHSAENNALLLGGTWSAKAKKLATDKTKKKTTDL